MKVSCPPVRTQQTVWNQPLTLLQEVTNEQSMLGPQHVSYTTQGQVFNQTSTLPFLQTATACITIPSTVWTPSDRNNLPRPPISMRGRPLSAGSARRVQTMGAPPVPSPAPSMPQSENKQCINLFWFEFFVCFTYCFTYIYRIQMIWTKGLTIYKVFTAFFSFWVMNALILFCVIKRNAVVKLWKL